jgi:hypothetical protein
MSIFAAALPAAPRPGFPGGRTPRSYGPYQKGCQTGNGKIFLTLLT